MRERIPSDSARWLVREMVSLGIPPGRILKGTNLPEEWLQDMSALIAPSQYLSIVANALEESGDPALGLHAGPRQQLGELGFWGYAIISSPTLREANQVALQFWELNGSLVTLDFREEPGHAAWRILPAFPMGDERLWIFAVEELLTTFHTAASFLTNHEFHYARIDLSYPDPGHGSTYRELFECPVFFGSGEDIFRADVGDTDRPTFTGHPQMALVCREQCRELQAKLRGSDDLTGAIREIIISSMGRIPHLPEVARRLAMSPRTLRRRLQERGTTYQHILDEVRIELAKEYLASTGLSVDQIAGRIGFTEATTFRKAFKKWTGTNIREFRIIRAEQKRGGTPSGKVRVPRPCSARQGQDYRELPPLSHLETIRK